MKKYTIFAAAFAMLAFASCNKEENNIARDAEGNYLITFTSEKGEAKAGFEADFMGQLFDVNDGIIMNGEIAEYRLQTIEGNPYATEDFSYCIQMAVPEATAESPIYFLYPSSQITIDEQGNNSVEMPENPIPAISMNTNDLNAFLNGEATVTNAWRTLDGVVWPMHAYLPNGVMTGHDGTTHFAMKNTTAFITPNVKYGRSFLAALAANNMIEAGLYTDGGAMPVLRITEVTFESDNHQLSGMGSIQNVYAENALLVMDPVASTNNNSTSVLDIDVYGNDDFDVMANGYNPTFEGATSTAGRPLGIVPVAVGENVNLQMTVHFTLTFATENGDVVYNGTYAGNNVTRTLVRNTNYLCHVNLYTNGDVSKVTFE